MESEPRHEGPFLYMILAPKKWGGTSASPSGAAQKG